MKRDRHVTGGRAGAFTLLELMVVVAIIGLVAAMSVPSILQMRREAPMRRAVNDILEVCERHHGVISITDKGTVPLEPRFHLVLEPLIQHMMQEDVR